MKHPFGNFVIQKALKLARNDIKKKLEEHVSKNIDRLGEKKIIDRWREILYNSENNLESPPRKRKESHKAQKKPNLDAISNGSQGSTSSLNNPSSNMIYGHNNMINYYIQGPLNSLNSQNAHCIGQSGLYYQSGQISGKHSPNHPRDSLFKKLNNDIPDSVKSRERFNSELLYEDRPYVNAFSASNVNSFRASKKRSQHLKNLPLQFEGSTYKLII